MIGIDIGLIGRTRDPVFQKHQVFNLVGLFSLIVPIRHGNKNDAIQLRDPVCFRFLVLCISP